jgi:transcriptional regulator with XRE-family HTH domain
MISREEAPENLVGELIRRQRELAELSMRQVDAMAGISNPYLSQIEHGLRAPSADVLRECRDWRPGRLTASSHRRR